MAAHHVELLQAARLLVQRSPGQRGRLSGARVRRAISTAYYALYGFLMKEVSDRVVGTESRLLVRRRMFARMMSHAGMKAAFEKVRSRTLDTAVGAFLQRPPAATTVPGFARDLAIVFCDAQAKRHDADYDMNAALSEADAALLIRRVDQAITQWSAAVDPISRDFKHALCLLLLFKGRLRTD